MPQVLKEDIERRILSAATEAFAELGYRGTTVAEIGRRAGLSTGNIYRYFKGKGALFGAIIDDAFVERFDRLLERRVSALASSRDMRHLGEDAEAAQRALLDFWVEERLRVIILLDRSEGTPRAGYGEGFVARLVEQASLGPGGRVGEGLEGVAVLTLTNIFDAARRAIVSILERYEDAADVRLGFEAFWSFQLAGLAGFATWVSK